MPLSRIKQGLRFLSSLKVRVLLFLLIIFSITFSVHGQNSGQLLVSGSFTDMPLKDILNSLEKQYGLSFYYEDDWLTEELSSASFDNTPLEEAISELLKKSHYSFEIIRGRYVVLLPRDHVAMLKGSMSDYRVKLDQSNLISLGDPSQTGKYESAAISGKVINGKNSEALLGATIWAKNTQEAVVSDADGRYTLNLKPGIYTIQVSSIGFQSRTYEIKLISDANFDVELFQETVQLDEVSVVARAADRNIRSTQMGMVELSAKAIKQLPTLNGEKDIVKSFVLMPGVQTSGEFSSGINVRGGSEDQNLYLLNDAPLFNTTHLFGLVTVINPDAVNTAKLYKGHIPSEYGERVSSIMDIQTNYNDNPAPYTSGGVGLYTSRVMTKFTTAKDKLTVVIGGRAGYPNWIIHQIQDYDLQKSSSEFYDGFATLHYKLKNHRFLLSYYQSYDKLDYGGTYAYSYGNRIGSFIWQHKWSENIDGKFTASFSTYPRSKEDEGYGQNAKLIKSKLNYYSGKYSLNHRGVEGHTPQIGIQAIGYKITPGEQKPLHSNSFIDELSLQQEQGLETSFFMNDKFELNGRTSLNLGLRATYYAFLGKKSVNQYNTGESLSEETITGTTIYNGGELIQGYSSLEPRLSILYRTAETSSIKLNYNRNKQYISLLSYTSIANPDDIWKLSDPYMKPTSIHQFALGYYQNNKANTIEASVELYYKHLKDIPEFKNDADIEMNDHIETELISAIGKNYGAEFMVKKSNGSLQGWISYTYSRSFNRTSGKFEEESIKNNEWYSSAYDKPHSLSVVLNYSLNKRLRLSTTFNYSTGRPVTLPEYQYNSGGQTIIHYSYRNKYRLPDYHRLDLAISMDENLKKNKKWKGSWTLSILNVYGRKNAYSVFYEKQIPGYYNKNKIYSLYKLYVIGSPVPTITYNFRF